MEILLLAVHELFFCKSLFHTSDSNNHANYILVQMEILNFVLRICAIDLIKNDSKMYKLMPIHLFLVAQHLDVVYALARKGNMDVNPERN
jgi:hypothetical protein